MFTAVSGDKQRHDGHKRLQKARSVSNDAEEEEEEGLEEEEESKDNLWLQACGKSTAPFRSEQLFHDKAAFPKAKMVAEGLKMTGCQYAKCR